MSTDQILFGVGTILVLATGSQVLASPAQPWTSHYMTYWWLDPES